MRLLDRAGRIVTGRVTFRGRDITRIGAGELRGLRGAAMSMIFQNPRAALNPIRTVEDQIADVLRAHRNISVADAKAQALELLNSVRIREAETAAVCLSGGTLRRHVPARDDRDGDRLRAGVADRRRADDGLDVTTQKIVMDLLAGITAERGMAMILITHDLGLAARYCGADRGDGDAA